MWFSDFHLEILQAWGICENEENCRSWHTFFLKYTLMTTSELQVKPCYKGKRKNMFSNSLSSFPHLFGLQGQRKGLMRDVARCLVFRQYGGPQNAELWYATSLPIQEVYYLVASISTLQLVWTSDHINSNSRILTGHTQAHTFHL